MAEKLNKVALFIVLLVVIALVFGQLGFTKSATSGGNAQASITIGEPAGSTQPAGGAQASITIFKLAPGFLHPQGTAAAVLTVQPPK